MGITTIQQQGGKRYQYISVPTGTCMIDPVQAEHRVAIDYLPGMVAEFPGPGSLFMGEPDNDGKKCRAWMIEQQKQREWMALARGEREEYTIPEPPRRLRALLMVIVLTAGIAAAWNWSWCVQAAQDVGEFLR